MYDGLKNVDGTICAGCKYEDLIKLLKKMQD